MGGPSRPEEVKLRDYEIMLILPAEADEALVATAIERISKVISPAGGSVGNIDRWGRRRFAFEIARQNEGYYVVARFTAEPSTQPELERVLKLADEVLRFKVMLPPEKKHKKEEVKKEEAASPAPA
jgi:small subunit ribosomal protein S6